MAPRVRESSPSDSLAAKRAFTQPRNHSIANHCTLPLTIPGKYNPFQLLVLALVESALFVVNSYIGYSLLGVLDIGGAIFIHAFGAFYGLAAREDGNQLNLDS